MELKKILIGIDGLKAKGSLDIDVKGLESNSKNIKDGYMFIAIKGFATDGHSYINDAIKAGAKVIMIEEGCDLIFLVAHDSGFYDYGTDRDFKFDSITSGDYVDGIFLGHDHFVKSGSINGVPYLEGGKNGNYISHMSFSFTLDKDKNFSLGNSRSYETILTQGIEFNTPNTLVDNLTTKYKEVIGDVNRVICSFNEYKSRDDLLNIACKAIISYINNHKDLYGIEVTVGVHNTGGVRDSAQRGDFTYSDLIRVFPFSNTLVLFNVTREEYYNVIDSNYSVIKEAPTFTNGVATIGTINYVAEYYGTNFTDTGILIQDVIEEYLSENY